MASEARILLGRGPRSRRSQEPWRCQKLYFFFRWHDGTAVFNIYYIFIYNIYGKRGGDAPKLRLGVASEARHSIYIYIFICIYYWKRSALRWLRPAAEPPCDFAQRCLRHQKLRSSEAQKLRSTAILSYPILSYPILCYPILSYAILSYAILSYPILCYPILSLKRKGKERKGKERKGKERKGKERKGMEGLVFFLSLYIYI